MKEFIHHKLQTFNELFEAYNRVQDLYINKSFQFDDQFTDLLKVCRGYYETKGSNSQIAEVLSLNSMFETAKRGINPFELVKVNNGKKELKMMVANHALDKLLTLLRVDYAKEVDKIEQAEELLSSIIMSLYQSRVLNNEKIGELNSIEKVQKFWEESVRINESISLMDKKLKLKLIAEDIYLIIEKQLIKIQ